MGNMLKTDLVLEPSAAMVDGRFFLQLRSQHPWHHLRGLRHGLSRNLPFSGVRDDRITLNMNFSFVHGLSLSWFPTTPRPNKINPIQVCLHG